MRRSIVCALLAGSLGLVAMAGAVGAEPCKPNLDIKDVHFSQMQPPSMERKWTALVAVDSVGLRGQFGRILRDRVRAFARDRPRARVPRAVRMDAAFGQSRS